MNQRPSSHTLNPWTRRTFIQALGLGMPMAFLPWEATAGGGGAALPAGSKPAPLALPHFPSRMHAFVWRNWSLVPVQRLSQVLGTSMKNVRTLARSMGMPSQPTITLEQLKRSYITIIRRNWHLLNYEQLLQLLDWSADELAFTLREDDFLYVKLGNLKPECTPLSYHSPTQAERDAAGRIAELVRPIRALPVRDPEPLFNFVRELSATSRSVVPGAPSSFSPRFCYSYFALYGDALLESGA